MSACEVLSSVVEFICGKLISIFLDFLCQTAKKIALSRDNIIFWSQKGRALRGAVTKSLSPICPRKNFVSKLAITFVFAMWPASEAACCPAKPNVGFIKILKFNRSPGHSANMLLAVVLFHQTSSVVFQCSLVKMKSTIFSALSNVIPFSWSIVNGCPSSIIFIVGMKPTSFSIAIVLRFSVFP